MSSLLALMLSFWNILVRWVLTVVSVMLSLLAISLFRRPLPIRDTISFSLAESKEVFSPFIAFMPCRMLLKVFLSSQISPLWTALIAFLSRAGSDLLINTPLTFLRRMAETRFSFPQQVSRRSTWCFLLTVSISGRLLYSEVKSVSITLAGHFSRSANEQICPGSTIAHTSRSESCSISFATPSAKRLLLNARATLILIVSLLVCCLL